MCQELCKITKSFIASITAYLCNVFLEADQFHDDDFEVSLGAGPFETALPFVIFQVECIRRGRPAANIIQFSRSLPNIVCETVNDKKRRAEFYDKVIQRISDCFGASQDVAIIEPTIQQQLVINPPRNLASLIERLAIAYGDAGISVINGIEASTVLPLDPAGAIENDLKNMILLKDQLPPSQRASPVGISRQSHPSTAAYASRSKLHSTSQ
ncbi:hypothetical protein [Undibacterium sp.]|uniref:hypothetical protein n=1 Tax=Undibacterium sp. TaxID=1914977 RepID=UPI003751B569